MSEQTGIRERLTKARDRWQQRRRPCPLVSYGECFRVCIPADECAAHATPPATNRAADGREGGAR